MVNLFQYNTRDLKMKPENMSVDLKRKVSFLILELILGILIGLLAISFSEKINLSATAIVKCMLVALS